MGMDSYGGRNDVKGDINVTPLVDVCLVLLIIFMVVTPMLQKGKPVLLPETEKPDKKPESSKEILVSIQADKQVFIEANWYPKREFVAKMKEFAERDKNKEIVIKADNRLTFGEIKGVMRDIQESGFEKVALVAQKPQKK